MRGRSRPASRMSHSSAIETASLMPVIMCRQPGDEADAGDALTRTDRRAGIAGALPAPRADRGSPRAHGLRGLGIESRRYGLDEPARNSALGPVSISRLGEDAARRSEHVHVHRAPFAADRNARSTPSRMSRSIVARSVACASTRRKSNRRASSAGAMSMRAGATSSSRAITGRSGARSMTQKSGPLPPSGAASASAALGWTRASSEGGTAGLRNGRSERSDSARIRAINSASICASGDPGGGGGDGGRRLKPAGGGSTDTVESSGKPATAAATSIRAKRRRSGSVIRSSPAPRTGLPRSPRGTGSAGRVAPTATHPSARCSARCGRRPARGGPCRRPCHRTGCEWPGTASPADRRRWRRSDPDPAGGSGLCGIAGARRSSSAVIDSSPNG